MNLFANPELFFIAESLGEGKEPVKKPEIHQIRWHPKKPDEMYIEFKEIYPPGTLTQVSQYGNGNVYQLKGKDAISYINLVEAKDKSGTFIVVWNQQPPNTAIDK